MTELPQWQRGYPIEGLKALARVFSAADKPYVLGAFTGFKERDVANALAANDLHLEVSNADGMEPVACLLWRRVGQNQGIKDFTGEVRARMEPGDIHVSRLASVPGHVDHARAMLESVAMRELRPGQAMFVSVWQESPDHRETLKGVPATRVAVKIPASSELIGVYAFSRGDRTISFLPLPERESWGLRRLDWFVPEVHLGDALAALSRLPGYGDHYSSYNKRHSWGAVALKGYDPDDPYFIEKPAEMSKKWKVDNPHRLEATCRDTIARRGLPELEPLIRSIPGEHQRIRLMRLQPGGGELTRHADITDPEAGTGKGKLLRIHIPLVTNPQVEFSSWTLEGQQYTRNFAVGSAWYLDTRKPHTAVNNGDTPRVHLVIDAFSSPDLLSMLSNGRQG